MPSPVPAVERSLRSRGLRRGLARERGARRTAGWHPEMCPRRSPDMGCSGQLPSSPPGQRGQRRRRAASQAGLCGKRLVASPWGVPSSSQRGRMVPFLLAALNVEEQDQALAELAHALHPIPPRSPHLPPAVPGTGPGCNPRDPAASRSLSRGVGPAVPGRMLRFPQPSLIPAVPGHGRPL